MDLEIEQDELLDPERKSIIATWYHLGKVIYIELSVNRSMLREIGKMYKDRTGRSQIFSITRTGKTKYHVEPTMVLLKKVP